MLATACEQQRKKLAIYGLAVLILNKKSIMVSKPEMIIDSASRRAATRRASKIKQIKQSKQAKLAKRVSVNSPGSLFPIHFTNATLYEKKRILENEMKHVGLLIKQKKNRH